MTWSPRSLAAGSTGVRALGRRLALVLASAVSAAADPRPPYLDPRMPVQARVNDLLARMTLPEKVGQMDQIEVTQVTDLASTCTSQGGFNMPNPACEQKVLIDNHA